MDSANAQTSSRPSSSEQATNEGLMKAIDKFLASSYIPFAELSVGVDRPVKAMVVRKWDSITLQKHYLSTDYVLADDQGGAIHCVARANISHCFTDKLLVGEVYSIANFTVAPPRPAFRIRNADPFVLHLEGNSLVKHLQCSPEGFNRYPLQLVPIPEVVDTGSRYLIDVVGCPINIGTVKTTPTGAQLLECHLINERGNTIKVSIWGGLGVDFLECMNRGKTPYIVVFTSMNVRQWNGATYLSTTSATAIYDTDEISAVNQMRNVISTNGMPPTSPSVLGCPAKKGTLSELLHLGREQRNFPKKDSVTFHVPIKIKRVLPENSWYYPSCGGRNCRKGLTHVGGQLFCTSCSTVAEFPRIRYRLHLEIFDNTATVQVTVFDDLAEVLVKKRAATLLKEVSDNPEECVLPLEIKQLALTYHIFEIKTHTYFAFSNDVEKFTVSRIVASVLDRKALDGVGGPSGAPTDSVSEKPPAVQNVIDLDAIEQHDKYEVVEKITPTLKTPKKVQTRKRKARAASSDEETDHDDEVLAIGEPSSV